MTKIFFGNILNSLAMSLGHIDPVSIHNWAWLQQTKSNKITAIVYSFMKRQGHDRIYMQGLDHSLEVEYGYKGQVFHVVSSTWKNYYF